MTKESKNMAQDETILDVLSQRIEENQLSKATLKTYIEALRRTALIVGVSYHRILRTPEVTTEALTLSLKNSKTLKTTIASLISVLIHVEGLVKTSDADFRRLKARWAREAEPVQKIVAESNQSSIRRDSDIEWTTVVAKNEELIKIAEERPKSARAQMDALMSSIYCDMPPRRQSDYADVHIYERLSDVPQPEPDAFVVMDVKRIKINVFKTSKKLGSYESDIHPTTFAALLRSLKIQPRDRLFPFMNANSFTKYHNANLKKWFGPSASNNTLRRARASALFGDATLSSQYKKEFARQMGHSISTNMDYAYAPSIDPVHKTYDTVKVDPTTGRVEEYTCMPKAQAKALMKRQ